MFQRLFTTCFVITVGFLATASLAKSFRQFSLIQTEFCHHSNEFIMRLYSFNYSKRYLETFFIHFTSVFSCKILNLGVSSESLGWEGVNIY